MSNLLSVNSERAEHPKDVNVKLKDHQLAMLKRCNNIENIENNIFGIMKDKPGTGKTYVVLSLIHQSIEQNKTNIIIVPQNIYSQWILSIENFSKNLSYKKFINYENIMILYNDISLLKESNIILTTSSYYHIIATTLDSLNIKISRVFFDEVDSISNVISTKINSDFIWFVSASFDKNFLGYYNNKLNEDEIENITCICESEFIDFNIYLDKPNKTYYLCKNIYIDTILENIITQKELLGFNAMDYTLHNKSFEKQKAFNEQEVIELILKNRKSIIELDKITIDDAKKNITFFEEHKKNSIINENNFKNSLLSVIKINEFKSQILDFLNNFNLYTDFYLDVEISDDDHKKIIKEVKRDELQSLRSSFENIIELLYNISEIEVICNEYIIRKKSNSSIEILYTNLKRFVDLLNNLNDILIKLKNQNENSILINEMLMNFFNIFIENKNYINELQINMNNYTNSIISCNQLEINNKLLEVTEKNITENKLKIDLMYNRLKDNDCCPVCYKLFSEITNNNIYISSTCCNNKICGECIDEWYNLDKTSCIFCNTECVNKESLLFYDKNTEECNTKQQNVNEDLIKNDEVTFLLKEHNKNSFLNKFISDLQNEDKKVIIFSDYSNIFKYIEELCIKNNINHVDLDKGNIKDIDISVNEYKYGNAKILLSNSTLFGCGMNFENSTHIIFVHKMTKDMENQVIGRAQRMGRKSVLEIIYLEYENESIYVNKPMPYSFSFSDDLEKTNELEDFYNNQQYAQLMENLDGMDFTNEVPPQVTEIIDVNLEELISNLE